MSDWVFHTSRVLLGLSFFWFGLNGFFHWRPLPEMNPAMTKFNEHLYETKIILPVVKLFEVIFGLALIANQWTLLATIALSPIIFFIALAHASFNRSRGIPMALGFVGLHCVLVIHHWAQLKPLFLP